MNSSSVIYSRKNLYTMVTASFVIFSQEKEAYIVNMYYELHILSESEQEDMAQLEIFLILILLITIRRNMFYKLCGYREYPLHFVDFNAQDDPSSSNGLSFITVLEAQRKHT